MKRPDKPPNILLIVTDQQHPDLAGYTGKTAVRTPHLDRLAAEGVAAARAYASCPLCTPSRASILCGQYPSRHAIHAERREEAELYDLEADPDELCNIARDHPALVAKLSQEMIRHIASVQGPWQPRPVFA